MPKSRWKDIERAEKNTPEGMKIFSELKQEYTERYLLSTPSPIQSESQNTADLEYGIE